jgi:excisionase family DNA binding protein
MDPLALTINESVKASATSRTALYEAIKRRELAAIKRGRRTLILTSELKRWLENLPKAA